MTHSSIARWGRRCMMFLAETCTLRRWCGQECHVNGIPHLSRALKIRGEYHGDGCTIFDSKSEKTVSQLATERAEAYPDHPFSHKVREGDTLTSIANKYKVTVQSIAIPNEISDVDYIPAGKSLLIPIGTLTSGEVQAQADSPLNSSEFPGSERDSVNVQMEGSFSRLPIFSSSLSFQSSHVRLALFLILLFSIFAFLRRCISDVRARRNEEVLRYQVEKEVEDAPHRPKLKRWQGILDDDRRVEEVDGDLLADGQTVLDAEEEKLRQSYAQLESVYVKFLADSGLSKSGYWRGGLPPALEEK